MTREYFCISVFYIFSLMWITAWPRKSPCMQIQSQSPWYFHKIRIQLEVLCIWPKYSIIAKRYRKFQNFYELKKSWTLRVSIVSAGCYSRIKYLLLINKHFLFLGLPFVAEFVKINSKLLKYTMACGRPHKHPYCDLEFIELILIDALLSPVGILR